MAGTVWASKGTYWCPWVTVSGTYNTSHCNAMISRHQSQLVLNVQYQNWPLLGNYFKNVRAAKRLRYLISPHFIKEETMACRRDITSLKSQRQD